MERAKVELRVGGQTYRVVASASTDELERLARVVDGKLREVSASSAFHPQSMLLVAMTLAHELELERAKGREREDHAKQMLRTLLDRVDAAIDTLDDEPVAPSPVPPHAEPLG